MKTRLLGKAWELRAESFLSKRGLRTLERNFQCRTGEIDLVMKDGEQLVFVEVRYRKSASHGSGADTVSRAKQSRLIRTAKFFLAKNRRISDLPCRFDVISIGEKNGLTQFDWIRHAFEVQHGTHYEF